MDQSALRLIVATCHQCWSVHFTLTKILKCSLKCPIGQLSGFPLPPHPRKVSSLKCSWIKYGLSSTGGIQIAFWIFHIKTSSDSAEETICDAKHGLSEGKMLSKNHELPQMLHLPTRWLPKPVPFPKLEFCVDMRLDYIKSPPPPTHEFCVDFTSGYIKPPTPSPNSTFNEKQFNSMKKCS